MFKTVVYEQMCFEDLSLEDLDYGACKYSQYARNGSDIHSFLSGCQTLPHMLFESCEYQSQPSVYIRVY